MQAIQEQFTPRRKSDATERNGLAAKVEALEVKLAGLEGHLRAGPDPAISRTIIRLQTDLETARRKLRLFDDKTRSREAAEDSSEAAIAKREFNKVLKRFEDQLQAFSGTVRDVLAKGQAYAQASGQTDAGRFPHKQVIAGGVGRRLHRVLLDAGAIIETHAPPWPHGLANLHEKWSGE